MSFGLGIGDFIAVSTLTTSIRKRLVHASGSARELYIHIKTLSGVLQDIEDVTSEQALSSSQKKELHSITEGCMQSLLRIVQILDRQQDQNSHLSSRSASTRSRRIELDLEFADDPSLRADIDACIREIAHSGGVLITFKQTLSSDRTSDTIDVEGSILHSLKQKEEILNWLTPIDYSFQQMDLIRRRQERTGNWFLDSTEFQSWLKGDAPKLLCPGAPGIGKTMLTSMVVDHIQQTFIADGSVGLAYVYCNYQRSREQNEVHLLASILKQLVESLLVLPDEVKDLYERHHRRAARPSLNEISKLLRSVMGSFQRTFIIIDALDECHDVPRRLLLSELLCCLQDRKTASFFATSRFDPDVMQLIGDSLHLEIRARHEDLKEYISQQILQLPLFVISNPDLCREIETTVLQTCDGMFLLARLHMDALKSSVSPKQIRRSLLSFSSTLSVAYKSSLQRIHNQAQSVVHVVMQVLACVTFALRPLNTSELKHALATEPGDSSFDPDNIPDLDYVVSSCAGLVEIERTSGIIRLVHYSAQQYLMQTQESLFPKRPFAHICLTYLSLDVFKNGPSTSDSALEERLESYPLLDYAANHWDQHLRDDIQPEYQQLAESLLSDEKLMFSMIQVKHLPSIQFRDYSQKYPRDISGLHLASTFGLSELVALLLDKGTDIDKSSQYYGTPLQAAAEQGHAEVARLLMNKGARIEAHGGRHDFAIHAASSRGHFEVVQVLLDHGADPGKMLNGRFNALHLAASNGYVLVVKALLQTRIDINAPDGEFGRTALAWATWNGHAHLVMYLLRESMSDINALDQQSSTALHLAMEKHHAEIINILIDHGASLSIANQQNVTATQMAFRDIRRIDPQNFQVDRNLPLRRGTQAGVNVLRLCNGPNASQEKYSLVLRKTFDTRLEDNVDARLGQLTREHEALRDLNHPNIVKFLAYDEDLKDPQHQQRHIYMEYCADGDLTKYVKANAHQRSLPPGSLYLTIHQVWSIVVDLASAIAYCHHGLFKDQEGNYSLKEEWEPRLHRDIKPGNIVMSTSEQGPPVAKLCDLGLAKIWDGGKGAQTRKVGTEKYFPPEVKDGNPWTMKGDIYSLGATIEDLRTDCDDEQLTKLVQKCKMKDPLNRPSSLKILQEARNRLSSFSGSTSHLNFLPNVALGKMKYLNQVVLETLERLFHSYSIYPVKRTKNTASRIRHLLDDGPPELLQRMGLDTSIDLAIILREEETALSLISNKCIKQNDRWSDYEITCLHLACLEGLEPVVDALVRHDPTLLTKQTSKWFTPLHWAVGNGHWKICLLLLKLQTEFGVFDEIEMILDDSSKSHTANNSSNTRKLFTKKIVTDGDLFSGGLRGYTISPLNRALLGDQLHVAKDLLKAGNASHTGRDSFGYAPLFIAATKNIESVNILIDAGADVKEDLVGGTTVLHLAAHSGNVPMLERLLELGIEVDFPEGGTAKGATPLARAIEAQHENAVSYLLSRGAHPDYEMHTTMTCIMRAVEIGNAKIVERMVKHKSPSVDRQGVCKARKLTALHIACQKGHGSIVELLLEAGWDINAKDKYGPTPLHLAVQHKHVEIVQILVRQEKIDVDASWLPEKQTPVHIACLGADLAILELLHEAGAKLCEIDEQGNLPVDLAKEAKNSEDIIAFLNTHKEEADSD